VSSAIARLAMNRFHQYRKGSSPMNGPPPDSTPPPPANTKDERTWAMLCHISVFSMFIFPLGNIIGPLVIWLIKKEEYPLVDDQGREVLNFQISVIIYAVISALLIFVLIGIPLLIALAIIDIILTIIGAMRANDGIKYRYPLTIRFF
jgi:uncharacterized Tic20 family protein